MDFQDKLKKAIKICGKRADDPFFLYCVLSDLVGNDYEEKKAAEEFYLLDAKYKITKTLISSTCSRHTSFTDKLPAKLKQFKAWIKKKINFFHKYYIKNKNNKK